MNIRSALSRTEENQWAASDPAGSAWVVANAGSGKTHVLTQRVVRLLLDGADPGSILCLTFTKTAAAEMSRRIFGLLADWATMSEANLRTKIRDAQGRAATPTELREARRLFARALETPGGLKIQTIHGFCERLLHQFPFEANVPGHFTILDDSAADALLAESRHTVMLRAREPGTRLSDALRFLAESCTDSGIASALDAVIARREKLRGWFRDAGTRYGGDGSLDDGLADLRDRLGLLPGETTETVCREICAAASWAREDCSTLMDALLAARNNTSDDDAHAALSAIYSAETPELEADARRAFFLNSEKDGSAKPRSLSARFSAAFRKQSVGLDTRFEVEAARLLTLTEKLVAARTVRATEALLVMGDAILQAYGDAKKRNGLLDFGDLIARTRHLLSRSDATAWILYKLDVRLRHILVDEAQDTSPDQWEIVRALTADFFSGASAVASRRTVFAVGDDKQSIFGFQGAAPAMLADMERHFHRAVRDAELPFERRPLFLSFRSTTEVLTAVDAVFGRPDAPPITASDYEMHAAHRHDHPGRVVVLPRIHRAKEAEPENWTDPIDSPTAAEVLLADNLTARIKALVGTVLPSGKRLSAGEVLILVRKRDAFVTAMNRALRREGVPASGADRIAVAEHIAVLDLLALVDVVLLPEDDLQLAALLKSPLVAWSEEALMHLAIGRKGTLWEALQNAEPNHCRAAVDRLAGWRAMADQVTPFRFFATVLGPEGGRRAFRGRLGGETDEVLDAFLGQALAYEGTEAPSLQGFAAFVRASRSDIKRTAEDAATGVRVMTVHGAKGLEADAVFLVDTGSAIVHPSHRDVLVELKDPVRGPAFLWRRVKADATELQRAADRTADAEAEREYFRLLYVAMTRARDLLFIAGVKGDRTPETCWFKTVELALAPPDAERDPITGELVAELIWPPVPRPDCKVDQRPEAAGEAGDVPDWLFRPAPSLEAAPEPLRPSRALAEPDPIRQSGQYPALDAGRARLRGTLVHKLLQWLPTMPDAERDRAAEEYLRRESGSDAGLAAEIRRETLAVLSHSDLKPFFGAGSRAEVAMVGTVLTARGEFAVSGQADRLISTPDGWILVDFKTDRAVPAGTTAVHPAYVLQLALYSRLLADMDPDRAVSAFLVYTAGPKIIPVLPSEMDAALARLGVLPTAVS